MVIYADDIFLLNTVAALLMLYAYALICDIKIRHIRIVAAATSCGIYAVFEIIFGISGFFRIILLYAITLLSFGRYNTVGKFIKLMFMLAVIEVAVVATAAVSGGKAVVLRNSVMIIASEPLTFTCFAASYPIMILLRYIHLRKKRICRIIIEYNRKRTAFLALRDSGNLLKYHDKPVIVAQWRVMENISEYDDYDEFMQNAAEFVMYSTMDGSGVLPLVVPDKCFADGAEKNAVVAITKHDFKSGYSGIIGN